MAAARGTPLSRNASWRPEAGPARAAPSAVAGGGTAPARRAARPAARPGAATQGVLRWLTPGHSTERDHYEAVAEGRYFKKTLIVQRTDGPVEALVYIDPVREFGQPEPAYLRTILEGAAHFGLPAEYIAGLARDWDVTNATSGQRE